MEGDDNGHDKEMVLQKQEKVTAMTLLGPQPTLRVVAWGGREAWMRRVFRSMLGTQALG